MLILGLQRVTMHSNRNKEFNKTKESTHRFLLSVIKRCQLKYTLAVHIKYVSGLTIV